MKQKIAAIFTASVLLSNTTNSQNANRVKMESFKIQIGQKQVDDLKARLSLTRWPEQTIDEGWNKGVPQNYLKVIANYWLHDFDWKQQELKLNKYPHFLTQIDGQQIHFLHIKSPHPNAVPLMLIHGWPGTFADFMDIIEPLTGTATNSAGKDIAFDLVIPSIPGFIFSNPVKEKGWNMVRMASAFVELMKQLGYEKFAVHGGDMGAGITGIMSAIAAPHLIGTHVNTDFYSIAGLGMFPSDVSAFTNEEKLILAKMSDYKKTGTGYLEIQSTKPETLGYGITDSPVGQLAWLVEKYKEWVDPSKALPEDALGMDRLLTNVALYWFTKSGASSAEMLYENMSMAFNWGGENAAQANSQWTPPKVPSAMMGFGKREYESVLKKLVSINGTPDRWTFSTKGGHFPAMEVPEVLAADLKSFFSGLKK